MCECIVGILVIAFVFKFFEDFFMRRGRRKGW